MITWMMKEVMEGRTHDDKCFYIGRLQIMEKNLSYVKKKVALQSIG